MAISTLLAILCESVVRYVDIKTLDVMSDLKNMGDRGACSISFIYLFIFLSCDKFTSCAHNTILKK